MVVYFLENHDFPIVDVQALIRVGDVYEPADKTGLASITGTVMRTGGSTETSGDVLDEKLESIGASVEVGIGDTQGTAGISTLSQNLEETLRILGAILRSPAFPEDKIDLAKKQIRTAIASRNDEGMEIAIRELQTLVYGKGHPYARYPEYATVDAITRDDLVAFHKTYFHPDRMILTVYGDFQTQKVEKLLAKVFGGWPKSTEPLPADPAVGKTEVRGNLFADKSDMTNSMIILGQEGMRMDNPDYPAMAVFHEVMSGGVFSGRLINEIRTKRGLAYGAGSFSGAQLHHPGPQGFYVMTQSDSTVATLGYLRAEVDKALAGPFTAEELQRAKDIILNSLVFSLSSKGAVLNRMAAYEFYGYPMDFLTKYQEAVRGMTADAVLAAAKRNIRQDGLATLIVGEKAKLKDQLPTLGQVKVLDITIPEPAGKTARPEATEADFARGQDLLAAALAAAGGANLTGLRDMTTEESGSFSVQGMEIQLTATTIKKFPDCERAEQKLPMGTVIQVVCGEEAWMDVMRGVQPMPPEARAEFEAERERELRKVLTGHAGLKLQALPGESDVEGRPALAVFVHSERITEWTIFVDKETGRIVRMDYRDRSMEGNPVLAKVLFEDYREVNGIQWPHRRRIFQDDAPLATLDVTSLKVNTGVGAEVFRKPS
jgi:predicted Zn-dependent peptidase